MADKKPDPTSDEARTGNDADKRRDDLKKQAAEGVQKATGQPPEGKD